jgi:hypothetical protein
VAVAHQPADEVRAHPSEPDHPQLHRRISWHGDPSFDVVSGGEPVSEP